jgi:ubiquinone/menaquinone biosynthesis C-methylase UbiE
MQKLDLKKIKDDLERYYRTAEQYSKRLGSHDESAYGEYVEFASRYVEKSAKLLDLGCGTGLSSSMLNDKGYDVTGLDLSEINMRAAGKTEKMGLKFIQGSALSLPFADNSFDAVGSFLFIEHILHVDICLAEMVRVVKKGGVIIILSPNLLSPFNQLYDMLNILLKKDAPTTFGERSAFRVLGRFFANNWEVLKKKFMRGPEFIYREPILENRFDYIPDNDAVYMTNPIDLKRWFSIKGIDIIKYQGETPFGKVFPNYVTGIHIVARKK